MSADGFRVESILAPYAFSNRCRGAARHAVALAARFRAELEFLHVVPCARLERPWLDADMSFGGTGPAEADVRRWLREEVERLPADGNEPSGWSQLVVRGEPASRIVERAEELPHPLIVMPTHGYGRFRRFLLGSVTAKVLHDSKHPVLTGAHLDAAGEFGRLPYRTVACAIQPGERAQAELEWAWSFARAWSAKLIVISEVEWFAYGPFEAQELALDLHRMLTKRTTQEMERLIDRVGCPAELRVELNGAADSIPRIAGEVGADLLIIGRTHEAGLLGSIWSRAYKLIRQSPCPVLSI